tara:strand:- start:50 stop:559 length:510 start_codon:yes stop_codon:yes gene_type:complete
VKNLLIIIVLLLAGLNRFGQNKNIEIVKEFSESYSPTSKPNHGIAQLDSIPNHVIQAFRNIENKKEEEKYLVLIFIKLYSAHLQCCHQSYDTRGSHPTIDKEKDPLVYEFNLLTKYYKFDKPIEFISSSLAYDWIQDNPHLLEYNKIKEQVVIIEQILKNVEKGVYWSK